MLCQTMLMKLLIGGHCYVHDFARLLNERYIGALSVSTLQVLNSYKKQFDVSAKLF